jgi:hypothetical protein
MKKILPVLTLSLLLTSLLLNNIVARLLDLNNLGKDLNVVSIDLPDLKVNIYPNPVINNRINITASREIKSIQVLTVVGSVVIDEAFQPGTTSLQIDLDKLSKGLYLLKIKFDEKNTYTEKIMVK